MLKINNKKQILILSSVFILTSHFLEAAPNIEATTDVREQKLSVFELKRKVEDQSKHINEISREMHKVEVDLGLHNKKYLTMAQERAKLEEALNVQKKNTDLDAQNLKKSYNETKAVLMGILLNRLEKTEAPSDMLARKILITNLQSKMIDLDALMKANNSLKQNLDELYQRLQASIDNEKQLVSIMNELEIKKKELRTTLEEESDKKEKVQIQFDEMKNKMAMEKDSNRRLRKKEEVAPLQVTEEIKIPAASERAQSNVAASSGEYRAPLMQNMGIEHNQKGVTFKFQGKNEVLATRSGKIAYTGSLANYGNVVMIDHGNDTRTVLLGQFDFNVKNGELVKDSQIIGYTNPKSVNGLGDGKIYFEVRKNNLAQNTYMLLDRKTLGKSSIK